MLHSGWIQYDCFVPFLYSSHLALREDMESYTKCLYKVPLKSPATVSHAEEGTWPIEKDKNVKFNAQTKAYKHPFEPDICLSRAESLKQGSACAPKHLKVIESLIEVTCLSDTADLAGAHEESLLKRKNHSILFVE